MREARTAQDGIMKDKAALNPAKANVIQSQNGKWHGLMLAFNTGHSFVTTMCGKTVFRRESDSALFRKNVSAFDADLLTCKNCKRAAAK
jgi:ABC-type xylose transport system permease subunit